MTKPHSRITKFRALIILGFVDLLFFGATNAIKVPAFWIIIGFCLMTVSMFIFLGGLFSALRYFGWPIKRVKRLAGYLTTLIGVLVALQSVGQLTIRDLAVLIPLVGLAYIYTSYQKRQAI